jgi:plasmid maintenance system antidote protein VapI
MKNPSHPGDIIRDCLDELGVSVTDGAQALA